MTVKDAAQRVVVIGRGVVGVEIVSELKIVMPDLKVTLVHCRNSLLSSEPLPDEFKAITFKAVQAAGIEVILEKPVASVKPISGKDGDQVYQVIFTDSSYILTGHVVKIMSKSVPSTNYLPVTALIAEGYVKIDRLWVTVYRTREE